MGIFRQFPYSNFHDMNMNQIIKIMREMQDEWAATKTEWASMRDFINNYFDNLDVSAEVLAALRTMAASGELSDIIDPTIINTVTQWLAEHITPTTPPVDDTLSIKGAAADAYEAGIIRDLLNNEIRDIMPILGVVPVILEQGSVNTNTGDISDNNNYIRTPLIASDNSTKDFTITNDTNEVLRTALIAYDADGNFISANTSIAGVAAGSTSTFTLSAPANTAFFRLRFNKTSVTAIDPEDVTVNVVAPYAEYYSLPANKGVISEAGTDLNNAPYIKGGSWLLADPANAPAHYPSSYRGKIISFATASDSTYGTLQVVVDNLNNAYWRFSTANNSWLDWHQFADITQARLVRDNSVFNYGNISAGTDLNEVPYIHPGIWAVTDANNTPDHAPEKTTARIISFASSSDNSSYTYQYYITAHNIYRRFSTAKDLWTPWYSVFGQHKDISFKCFEKNDMFANSFTIIQDPSSTNRVATLMAKWDAVTVPAGVNVTKTVLGRDASNTFDIFNYKVSNNVGNKPKVLVVFGEHGNEYNSAEIGSYFYNEVVNGVLAKYLKYVDFWLIPLMNPWGYENKQRNNYNDVNLNRDFPCEWNYYAEAHNKTGNYPLSQPETQYLYNLLVNNRNNILFMCNKHNTGSISTKININEEDLVGYTATVLESDSIINRGVAYEEDAQVRVTDPWIITDCDVDISDKPFIVDRYGLITAGSMDLFANSIKIHGSLLEVCGAAKFNTDTPPHYSSEHYQGLARLELDYIVNYISKTIENNDNILNNDKLSQDLKYKTRVQEPNSEPIDLSWEQGSVNTNTGAVSDNPNYCRTTEAEINGDQPLLVTITNNGSATIGAVAVYYDADHNFISSNTGVGSATVGNTLNSYITPPATAKYVRIRVAYNPVAAITTAAFTGSVRLVLNSNVNISWEQGSVNTNTGALSDNPNYCRTTEGIINGSHDLAINFTNNGNSPIGLVAVYYDDDHNFISSDTKLGTAQIGVNYLKYITPPVNARYVRLRVAYNPLAVILPTEFSGSITLTDWRSIEQYWNGYELVNVE